MDDAVEKSKIEEPQKSFFKKWWLVGLIVILVVGGGIFALANNKKDEPAIISKTEKIIDDQGIKTDCPSSITYQGDDPIPIADYAGTLKQVDADMVTQIRNYCPDTIIQSVASSSSQSVSSGSTARVASSSSRSSSSSTSTSAAKLANETIITPYFDESDIISVNEAYSMDENNPYWGFRHPGVDFMTSADIRVRASAGGTIENLETAKSDGIMGWHTGFCINTGTENGVCYNLETFSSEQSVGDRQIAGMKIKTGDTVKQGDHIGDLIYGGSGAHIDFGVTEPGTRICPEPYFTTAARESVMRLIRKTQPTWPMCDV